MIDDQTDTPNIAEILGKMLRNIDPHLQPLLLAKLERLASNGIERGQTITRIKL